MRLRDDGKVLTFDSREEYVKWQARKCYATLQPHAGQDDIRREWHSILSKRIRPEDSLLDIGARDATLAWCMKAWGHEGRVICVDIQEAHVQLMESRIKHWRGFKVAAMLGDHMALPFQDREFDVVVSRHTLEHCDDVPKAASEAQRVCRRLLYVVVPLRQEIELERDKETHCYRFDSELELARLFPEFTPVVLEVQGEAAVFLGLRKPE